MDDLPEPVSRLLGNDSVNPALLSGAAQFCR
jgi:hypothetical protein